MQSERLMNTTSPVRLAAIADLHITQASHQSFRDLFAEISTVADVLLLCGDLTNLGLPEEAELLASDLHLCRIPVLGVLGNHDHHSGKEPEVKSILRSAMVFLDEETHELRHVGFAGVKGFAGGFDHHMLTSFGEDAVKHFVGEA